MNAFTEYIRKHVKSGLFLTLIVGLFSTGCTTDSQQNQNRLESFSDAGEVINRVDTLLEKLWAYDIESSSFEDSAAQVNESIQKLFEQASDQSLIEELNDYYKPDVHLFSFAISIDKKIAVCSWDSRMGGSMKDFNSIAFYKLEGQPKFALLDHDELFYDNIYTITDVDHEVSYLFHGTGTASTVEFYNKVEAFIILLDTIAPVAIFPSDESSLVNYWTIDSDEIDFKFDEDGLQILQPKILDIGSVFYSLQFDGDVFIEKIFKDSIDFDFHRKDNFYPRNEYKLINGSELPIARDEMNNHTLWTFKDQLTIDLHAGEGDEIIIQMNENGDKFLFKNDNYLSLRGRSNSYLFFSNEDGSDTWMLYIYDIKIREFILSIPVSDVIMKGNRLVYTQLINTDEIKNIEAIRCDPNIGDQKGYFKVYTLEFSKPTPTIESVDYIFCGLVQ